MAKKIAILGIAGLEPKPKVFPITMKTSKGKPTNSKNLIKREELLLVFERLRYQVALLKSSMR